MNIIQDTMVIRDAGHGGMKDAVYQTKNKKLYHFTDHGTTVNEGELNRKFDMELEAELNRFNIPSIPIHHPYIDTALRNRSNLASAIHTVFPNAILISSHNNAAPKTAQDVSRIKGPGRKAYGSELWTYKNPKTGNYSKRSFALGESIAEQIKLAVPGQKWRGHKQANFHMTREPSCPCVLLEYDFFDNWESYQKLNDVYFRYKLIGGVTLGIYNYLTNQLK